MIKADVHVHRMSTSRNQTTGVASHKTIRTKVMDFKVECVGAASDAILACRKAFSDRYAVPLQLISANFEANKNLDGINLVYRE